MQVKNLDVQEGVNQKRTLGGGTRKVLCAALAATLACASAPTRFTSAQENTAHTLSLQTKTLPATNRVSASQTYTSRAARLAFEIPFNRQVLEREICRADDKLNTVVTLKITRADKSEEAALDTPADVTIEVAPHRFVSDATGAADTTATPSAIIESFTSNAFAVQVMRQSETPIADGRAATSREVIDADGTARRELYFASDSAAYLLSAPMGYANQESEDDVFSSVVSSLRLLDEAEQIADQTFNNAPTIDARTALLPGFSSTYKLPLRATRIVYLVPADKSARSDYYNSVVRTALDLRSWFQNQLGGGLTYNLPTPSIEVRQTAHTTDWYATNKPASGVGTNGYFWENVLTEAFALTGGKFNDAGARWIFIVDADPLCNQYIGGTNGVALLAANDLRGLSNNARVPVCQNDAPDSFGQGRWRGVLGHEMGHAFGLLHPVECEDNNPQTPCPETIMYTGHANYPATVFLPREKLSLIGLKFFTVQPSFKVRKQPRFRY